MSRSFSNGRNGGPPLSDIEVARMWRALATTPPPLPARSPIRRTLILGLGLAGLGALVAFAVVWLLSTQDAEALAAISDPSPVFDREYQLPDGTTIALGAEARVEEVEAARPHRSLALLKGAAVITVAADPTRDRRVTVLIGNVSVVSRAARLRVALSDEPSFRHVDVSVLNGHAELHFSDNSRPPQILNSGETWSGTPQ